jgi:hypothetical protein
MERSGLTKCEKYAKGRNRLEDTFKKRLLSGLIDRRSNAACYEKDHERREAISPCELERLPGFHFSGYSWAHRIASSHVTHVFTI